MSLKSAMQKVLNTHKRKLSVSHGEAGKQEQLMVLAKSPFNNKKKKVTTNCSKDGGVSSLKHNLTWTYFKEKMLILSGRIKSALTSAPERLLQCNSYLDGDCE